MIKKEGLQLDNIHIQNKEVQRIYLGGADNILLKSSQSISNGDYLIASYYLSKSPINNEIYTITIWGKLGETKSYFSLFNTDGYVSLIHNIPEISPGVYSASFTWRNTANGHTVNNKLVRVYAYTQADTSISKINKIKLEKGVNSTPIWSPADSESTHNSCVVYKKSPAYNLLLNSNFKNGYTSWTHQSNTTIDVTKIYNGRYSLKLEQSGLVNKNWYGITQDAIVNNNPALLIKAGTIITFSCYVYTDDLSTFDYNPCCDINFFKSTSTTRFNWYSFSIKPTKANEWQQIIQTITIPNSTEYIGCYIYLSMNGRLWVNSPKLEIGEIPYPEWMPAAYEIIPNILPSTYFNIEGGAIRTKACKLSNLIYIGRNQGRANFISTYKPNKNPGYFSVSFWAKTIEPSTTAYISCDINDKVLPQGARINNENWTFISSTIYIHKYTSNIYGFIDFNISDGDINNVLVSDVCVTPTKQPLNYWIPSAESNFLDNYITLTSPGTHPNYYPYKATEEQWRDWTNTRIDWLAGNITELNIGDIVCVDGIITNLNNNEVPIKCIGIIDQKDDANNRIYLMAYSKIIYGL